MLLCLFEKCSLKVEDASCCREGEGKKLEKMAAFSRVPLFQEQMGRAPCLGAIGVLLVTYPEWCLNPA